MAAIRETLELSDNFSQTFRNFDAAANASIAVTEEFQRALMEFSQGYLDGLVEELQSSRNELASMASEIENASTSEENFGNEIKNADDEIKKAQKTQSDFTKEVQNTEKSAGNLYSTLSKVATAIGAASLVKSFISTSDEMTQITAKLNLINDGSRTTAELQNAIYNSAERARGSFMDTATLVARLGMNAKDAFKSNQEMIDFAENLNKSFKIAGASAQEQASVILQMSQALASGVLRGQEFNAVMSGAPNVMQNVAQYLHVSVGSLREMAAQGQISASVVKNALLSATATINNQFNEIPLTFSDVMTSAKNKLVDGLTKTFNEWSKRLNDTGVQASIDNITTAIENLAQFGGAALMQIADIVNDIARNWDIIEPIIVTVGTAIVSFKVLNIIQAAEVGAAWATAFGGLPLLIGGAVGLVTTLSDAFSDFDTDATKHVDNVKTSIDNLGGAIDDFSNAGVENVNAIGSALETVGTKADQTTKLIQGVTKEMNAIAYNFPIIGDLMNWANNVSWKITTGRTYDDYKTEQKQKELLAEYNLSWIEGESDVERFNRISEAINKKWQSEQQAQRGEWYNEYYGRDTGYHINEEDWTKPWYGYQHELFATYVAENNANLKREQEETRAALEAGKIKVGEVDKINSEVKLSDEDLRIFRDIAENKYVANVELQTLAPQIAVNIENATGATPDELADILVAKIEEEMSERTAISH